MKLEVTEDQWDDLYKNPIKNVKQIGEYNCVETYSMTDDCPDEWIETWKKQGYNLIHYTGNGCDTYTLMDQITEIKF